MKTGKVLMVIAAIVMIGMAGFYAYKEKPQQSPKIQTTREIRDPFRPEHINRQDWKTEKRRNQEETAVREE